MLAFTDWVPQVDTRQSVGQGVIYFALLNILFNLFTVSLDNIRKIFLWSKYLYLYSKAKMERNSK